MKILENLRAAAKKEWEKFQNSARVMVGAATCGRAAGAGAVMDEFKKVLKEKAWKIRLMLWKPLASGSAMPSRSSR